MDTTLLDADSFLKTRRRLYYVNTLIINQFDCRLTHRI